MNSPDMPAQKRMVPPEWNGTDTPFNYEMTIHRMFEEQAEKTPEDIALICSNEKISYRELNERANRLAHSIRNYCHTVNNSGLLSDTLIGICMNRGIGMIIAVLGILKAGCAYVPLDPSYPYERLRFMMDDSQAPFIVTEQSLLEKLLFLNKSDYGVISLDGGWAHISEFSEKNPEPICSSRNLAYVIYTSGSTGKPKGATIEHIGVINLVLNDQKIRRFNGNTRMMLISSLNFDAATAEIFPALLCGATLHIATDDVRKDPERLLNYIQKQSITDLSLTPAFLKLLPHDDLPSLKSLLIGGDICDAETMKFWSKDRLFINAYGPTECTVCATECIYDEKRLYNEIGSPICNARVYVLDGHMNQTPVGEAGEIYIGGIGVARGYLRRPELTKERFIENPFSSGTEKKEGRNLRLYRSGDRGKWLDGGTLEFLGRIDFQVKINGHRIEPEEIESVLSSHNDVRDCAVIALEDGKDKRLIAYYVPSEVCSTDNTILRTYLLKYLPEYMIPSRFVRVESLPLSPSGKLDRNSLPEPSQEASCEYSPPVTETEKRLSDIWKELFNLDQIGINDNFFEIGGDSILTVKMLSAIKKRLGMNINIAEMFTMPTVASLAACIDGTGSIPTSVKDNIVVAKNDAKREITVNNISTAESVKLSTILLTGITGFLGIHLLDELISSTKAMIICVIRGENYDTIRKRFEENLVFYKKEHLRHNPRIELIKWDMKDNITGIEEDKLYMLKNSVDSIYHCGAIVNHLYDYRKLKRVNLEAVLDLLKIAAEGPKKTFNYISTLDVACIPDSLGKITEVDAGDIPPSANGYILTKWVCEKILENVSLKGIDINIFRPANITGDSIYGICHPEKNHNLLLLKGCMEMKAAPDWKKTIEMTPVDIISRAIVELSYAFRGYQVFNMNNPHEISWLDYISYFKDRGFEIEIIPTDIWKEKYLALIDEKNSMFPLKELYLNEEKMAEGRKPFSRWNSREVQMELKRMGILYPDNYDDYMKIQIKYLIDSGFLHYPPAYF